MEGLLIDLAKNLIDSARNKHMIYGKHLEFLLSGQPELTPVLLYTTVLERSRVLRG